MPCCCCRGGEKKKKGWSARGWLQHHQLPDALLSAEVVSYAYGQVKLGSQDERGFFKSGSTATEDPRWHHACLLLALDIDALAERDALGSRANSLICAPERWSKLPGAAAAQSDDPAAASAPADAEGPAAAGAAAGPEGGAAAPHSSAFDAADAESAGCEDGAEDQGDEDVLIQGRRPNVCLLSVLLLILHAGLWVASFALVIYPLFFDPDAGPWVNICHGQNRGWGHERCILALGQNSRGLVAVGSNSVGFFLPICVWTTGFGVITGLAPIGVAGLLGGVSAACGGAVGVGITALVGYKCPFALVLNKRGTQLLPVCLSEPMEVSVGPRSPVRGSRGSETALWRVDYGTESIVYFSPVSWSSLHKHIAVAGGWQTPPIRRTLSEVPRPQQWAYQVYYHNCQDYVLRCIDVLASKQRKVPWSPCCVGWNGCRQYPDDEVFPDYDRPSGRRGSWSGADTAVPLLRTPSATDGEAAAKHPAAA
eukprot:TRINITY_DN6218_c0_g1_i1.p1 TRINITY_DN6218_c0_g1~~TRINITY_DN6218_c0_g1_i1.p1  ORF type:complete len:481 (+),score=68.54 TRINITY_DN6218_c0_g1_i1:81-1523(+)